MVSQFDMTLCRGEKNNIECEHKDRCHRYVKYTQRDQSEDALPISLFITTPFVQKLGGHSCCHNLTIRKRRKNVKTI